MDEVQDQGNGKNQDQDNDNENKNKNTTVNGREKEREREGEMEKQEREMEKQEREDEGKEDEREERKHLAMLKSRSLETEDEDHGEEDREGDEDGEVSGGGTNGLISPTTDDVVHHHTRSRQNTHAFKDRDESRDTYAVSASYDDKGGIGQKEIEARECTFSPKVNHKRNEQLLGRGREGDGAGDGAGDGDGSGDENRNYSFLNHINAWDRKRKEKIKAAQTALSEKERKELKFKPHINSPNTNTASHGHRNTVEDPSTQNVFQRLYSHASIHPLAVTTPPPTTATNHHRSGGQEGTSPKRVQIMLYEDALARFEREKQRKHDIEEEERKLHEHYHEAVTNPKNQRLLKRYWRKRINQAVRSTVAVPQDDEAINRKLTRQECSIVFSNLGWMSPSSKRPGGYGTRNKAISAVRPFVGGPGQAHVNASPEKQKIVQRRMQYSASSFKKEDKADDGGDDDDDGDDDVHGMTRNDTRRSSHSEGKLHATSKKSLRNADVVLHQLFNELDPENQDEIDLNELIQLTELAIDCMHPSSFSSSSSTPLPTTTTTSQRVNSSDRKPVAPRRFSNKNLEPNSHIANLVDIFEKKGSNSSSPSEGSTAQQQRDATPLEEKEEKKDSVKDEEDSVKNEEGEVEEKEDSVKFRTSDIPRAAKLIRVLIANHLTSLGQRKRFQQQQQKQQQFEHEKNANSRKSLPLKLSPNTESRWEAIQNATKHKIEKARESKERELKSICTFQPEIYSAPPPNYHNDQDVHSRLFHDAEVQRGRVMQKLSEKELEAEAKLAEECPFVPNRNRSSPEILHSRTSAQGTPSGVRSEVDSNSSTLTTPDVIRHVQRHRKARMQRSIEQLRYEQIGRVTDESYAHAMSLFETGFEPFELSHSRYNEHAPEHDNAAALASASASASARHKSEPDLLLKVRINDGRQGVLRIHRGDDPRQLAMDFADTYNISSSKQHTLEEYIEQVMEDHGLDVVWQMHWSTKYDRWFFFNTETGETSWEPPTDIKVEDIPYVVPPDYFEDTEAKTAGLAREEEENQVWSSNVAG